MLILRDNPIEPALFYQPLDRSRLVNLIFHLLSACTESCESLCPTFVHLISFMYFIFTIFYTISRFNLKIKLGKQENMENGFLA